MFDLNGTYTHNVDAKGRVSLPAKFRKKLPTDLVVRYSMAGDCLYVFEEESHNEWVASFFKKEGGYDPLDSQHVAFRSMLKGEAKDVSQDSAGRILLPADMRKKVGIEKEAVLVGNTGYFEVWNPQRREEAFAHMDLASFMH